MLACVLDFGYAFRDFKSLMAQRPGASLEIFQVRATAVLSLGDRGAAEEAGQDRKRVPVFNLLVIVLLLLPAREQLVVYSIPGLLFFLSFLDILRLRLTTTRGF